MVPSAVVTEQPPPWNSRLAGWYDGADLLDSFVAQLPAGSDCNVRLIGQAILGHPTPWFKALLSIRDGVVRQFGLKTSGELSASRGQKEKIDFFTILSADNNELILGEDDKHLDVRISLLIHKKMDGPSFVCVTAAVRCHNRLGRVYIAAIKPFHRLIVRSQLLQAAKTDFAAASKT